MELKHVCSGKLCATYCLLSADGCSASINKAGLSVTWIQKTLPLQERLAAKAKREQMLLDSFIKQEEEPVFEDEDELVMETFSRRPSHAAQHEIVERLSGSPSQTADLLSRQHPEQKFERTHSPKAAIRGASSNYNHERHLSEFTGMEGDEDDYDDLQRDSGSDDSSDEDFDSD